MRDISIQLDSLKISEDKHQGEFEYYLPKITDKKIPYKKHIAETTDKQIGLRPKEVVFCEKCVISNQRPRISFDDKGVCSACNYAEYKKRNIDWAARELQFERLLDKYRSNDGRWDVIVPASGGKDSGSLAHKLKYEHGMNPLCVTWAPLLYTDIGMQNYQNMLLSGLDGILGSPNRLLQRKLAKLSFVLQGDHFEAFSRGQMAFPIHVAVEQGVRLIMFGENAELEYGGDTKNMNIPRNPFEDWDRFYFKSTSFNKLIEKGVHLGYLAEKDLIHPSLKWYKLPPKDIIHNADLDIQWFGWYFNWIPQENYYYVAEHYNFQALDRRSETTYSKYASLDDLTDPFHFYMALIKFGIGRATADAAHEVRDNHITRSEAVALVRKYDAEFPEKYFNEFLEYLDMEECEFWDVINVYRSMSPHIWAYEGGSWRLKHQVA